MNNREIRLLLFEKNVRKYQVAEKLGITCYTFSRWLQTEMKPEKRERVIRAILSIEK